jgi:hypothetical protein
MAFWGDLITDYTKKKEKADKNMKQHDEYIKLFSKTLICLLLKGGHYTHLLWSKTSKGIL